MIAKLLKVYIGINNKTDKFRQELIWQKRLRQCTRFYYKQQFYKQRQAEIEKKKKTKGKQYPEAEHFLFENYSYSSPTLSSKSNRTYSKQ